MEKKTYLKIIIQCLIFAAISCICSILVHAFNSAFIEGVHGKPSFVTNTLFLFNFYTNFSFAIVYVLIGHLIPIKNKILKGFVYIALIWASNFMPQIMGLACADGKIAEDAFSASIVICDTIVYLMNGLVLGLLVTLPHKPTFKPCSKRSLAFTSIISMLLFPSMVIVMDTILKSIDEKLGGRAAMGVSQAQATPFYLCFFSCFFVTGVLLPLFYRLTLYNSKQPRSSLKFGLIYSVGIWTPIVLIMIVFGTDLIPTLLYTLTFIVIHILIALINGYLLARFEKCEV